MHYFIARTVLMIACGAFGALTVGNVKWVWWFFGMLWFFHIIFALGKSWAEAAKAKGGESGSVYSKIAGITVITWFCYPIVWVFAEGFGNFSVTFEVFLARALLCVLFFFKRYFYRTRCTRIQYVSRNFVFRQKFGSGGYMASVGYGGEGASGLDTLAALGN